MTRLPKPLGDWLARLRTVVARQREPASRSYRFMSQLIEQEFPDPEKGACLAFFSADSDSVAADTLLMLAHSLQGELDSRVLLIDARFRDADAGLTGRLDRLAAPGFAEIMREGLEGWTDYICTTALEHVDVLPAGLLVRSDTLNLDRERWSELLAAAAGRYRHVLVQVSSVMADTRSVLAVARTDAVFIIVQENLTLMKVVADARRLLLNNGIEELRVVLSTPEQ